MLNDCFVDFAGTTRGRSTPSIPTGRTQSTATGTPATTGTRPSNGTVTTKGASTPASTRVTIPSGSTSAGTSGTARTSGSSGTTGTARTSGSSGTTGTARTSGSSGTTGTARTSGTSATSGTTTARCAEMQAVDETVSKQITVTPNELPKGENIEFQVTSTRGVSFPKDERTPTIVVQFGTPAEVQSVTIPRDKTPNANVQQFEVTFFGPDGEKINDKPILSNSSPKDDTKKPARLDSTQIPSTTPVSRLEITVVRTTDGESPKGVILDIQACTEITTGEHSLIVALTHISDTSPTFLIPHPHF